MVTKPTIYTEEFVLNEIRGFLETVKQDESIMFWQDLVRDKEYSRERISEWKKKFKSKEISHIIKKIHAEFETRLIKAGLGKHVNPVMAIFVLKNHHGMRDKIETEENVSMRIYKTKTEILDGPPLAGSESEVDV